LRDGNRHSPYNLPIILAGRGGGKLCTGQHLIFEENTPLANLYLSMAHVMGLPIQQFADSSGELSGILA
ncbi:MAG: hypothetical protein D6730_11460, partial [Bacteroidetes bacterium]